MDYFIDWFTNRNATWEQNFLNKNHLIGLMFLVVMIYVLLKYKDKIHSSLSKSRKLDYILGSVMFISLTVLLMYNIIFFDGDIWKSMPFHFCSVAYIFNIIALFTNSDRFKSYGYYMGITGGLLGLAFPGIRMNVLYYRALEYYFSHSLLVTVSLYHLLNGLKVENDKIFKEYLLFLLVSSWFMYCWNVRFDSDFYFLNGTISTSPSAVLEVMFPWPGYYFVLLFFAQGMGCVVRFVTRRSTWIQSIFMPEVDEIVENLS